MAKSYREYLRVASAQILIKRGHCSHPHDWKEEAVLYFRCQDCGAFVPLRNPFETERVGELGQGEPNETAPIQGAVVHEHISSSIGFGVLLP